MQIYRMFTVIKFSYLSLNFILQYNFMFICKAEKNYCWIKKLQIIMFFEYAILLWICFYLGAGGKQNWLKYWMLNFWANYLKHISGPYKRALIAAHHCGLRQCRNPRAAAIHEEYPSHGLGLVDCGSRFSLPQPMICGRSTAAAACQGG